MTYERISKFTIVADRTSKRGKVTKDCTLTTCAYISTAEGIVSEIDNTIYTNIRIIEG